MVDGRCKREATVANLERFRGPEGGITVPQVLDCDTFFSGWFAESYLATLNVARSKGAPSRRSEFERMTTASALWR
jgi:hypothetical protein